jgi:hypothetical protein
MADFKKITGFQTPDGVVHDTEKQATEHVKNIKIKAALKDFAETADLPGVEGHDAVHSADLAEFLFANKDAIAAAFNPEIRTRAPRKDKGAKRTKKDTPTTTDVTETATPEVPTEPVPTETTAPAATEVDELDALAAELDSAIAG